jgi:hypothetical protein
MSGKNIVNPDHYKIAGRDRPNETVRPGSKEAYSEDRARLDKRTDTRRRTSKGRKPPEEKD